MKLRVNETKPDTQNLKMHLIEIILAMELKKKKK